MLGSNVSTVGGLHRGFGQASQWQCDAIQIYTTPSRRWEIPSLSSEQRIAFEAARQDSPVKVVVAHVPFLVNICAEDAEALQRSERRLIEEIRRADMLSVESVILHPGAAGGSPKELALRKAASTVRAAVEATAGLGVRVLIENMAGQGTTLCGSFGEIGELLDLIGLPERVGVCFDTAHAFMAGYNLIGYRGYEQVFGEFDQLVGWKNVFAMHINDSKTAQGSRHDRHAPVGEGRMGLQVFHALMRDPRFTLLPRILEVPERDTKSFQVLELLRGLANQVDLLPISESEASPGAVQMSLKI
jgi:deoxyribonuclease-4